MKVWIIIEYNSNQAGLVIGVFASGIKAARHRIKWAKPTNVWKIFVHEVQ